MRRALAGREQAELQVPLARELQALLQLPVRLRTIGRSRNVERLAQPKRHLGRIADPVRVDPIRFQVDDAARLERLAHTRIGEQD